MLDFNEVIKQVESKSEDELLLDVIKEYTMGGRRAGAKYLQRLGTPGHYQYVYSPKAVNRMTRKAKFYYARFLKRSARWLNKLSVAYDAKTINVKPVTWKTAIVNIQKNNGMNVMLHVDLKSHQIYSYKSHRGQFGASTKLSRAKKKGILRFR